METMKFKSNGKLMITGEYLALDNALVLTLPTKFGQSLTVKETEGKGTINWTSLTNENKVWFEASLKLKNKTFKIVNNSNEKIATTLLKILNTALELSTINFSDHVDYEINTLLDFPQNWGLGSSSTLLNNIAQWFEINPFELHFSVFNGSGYDVAAAYSNEAITYQINYKKPIVKSVEFNPSFKNHLYFVHLNQKQNSYNEVKKYQENKNKVETENAITLTNSITCDLIKVKELGLFEALLQKHEAVLARILGLQTIQEQLFSDYKGGIIKSLGAWGGDFILITIRNKQDLAYFKNKGYSTILSYDKIIL